MIFWGLRSRSAMVVGNGLGSWIANQPLKGAIKTCADTCERGRQARTQPCVAGAQQGATDTSSPLWRRLRTSVTCAFIENERVLLTCAEKISKDECAMDGRRTSTLRAGRVCSAEVPQRPRAVNSRGGSVCKAKNRCLQMPGINAD